MTIRPNVEQFSFLSHILIKCLKQLVCYTFVYCSYTYLYRISGKLIPLYIDNTNKITQS